MSRATRRLIELVLVAGVAWYVPWVVSSADLSVPWVSVPFVAATLLLALNLVISAANNWTRTTPQPRTVAAGDEPRVAVVIPTAYEDAAQLRRTAESVLAQDWPARKLLLVVSDDAGNPELEQLVMALADTHPDLDIRYHRPPPRGDRARNGEAKAGNLNSVLELIDAEPEHLRPVFVETRDADDLTGDRPDDDGFLRRCVGELESDARIAYVQTIKASRVSPADPFENQQAFFFRNGQRARHAANAVWPCGSGIVWRRAALADVGDFPTWNLVEDLQAGVEVLARGWRGSFVPIVGAVAQHAPEDIPNLFKQRGTWALDTVRLLLWRRLSGLSLRQRMQFWEVGLFYLLSYALAVFVLTPAVGLLTGTYPLRASTGGYALHFWPFIVALELHLAVLNRGMPYETLWRARQMWAGLMPVYWKAVAQAVAGGPHRKPTYVVTRKYDHFAWYWRETLPQVALAVALLAGLLGGLVRQQPLLMRFDFGSAFWSVFFLILLGGFLRRSWFGLDLGAGMRERLHLPARTSAPDERPTQRPAPARAAGEPDLADAAPEPTANGLDAPAEPLRAAPRRR